MQNNWIFYLTFKKEQLYGGTFEKRATVPLEKGRNAVI